MKSHLPFLALCLPVSRFLLEESSHCRISEISKAKIIACVFDSGPQQEGLVATFFPDCSYSVRCHAFTLLTQRCGILGGFVLRTLR